MLISRIQHRLEGSLSFLPSLKIPGAFDKFLKALIQFLNTIPDFQKLIGDEYIYR